MGQVYRMTIAVFGRGIGLLFCFVLAISSFDVVSAELTQTRIALVIANTDYSRTIGALQNTKKDAELVAVALKSVGFTVSRKEDVTQQELRLAILEFKRKLIQAGKGAVGFFYYAGHGGADKVHQDNFLVPIDATSLNPAIARAHVVSMNWIKSELEFIRDPAAMVLVIDACRTLSKSPDARSTTRAPSMGESDLNAEIVPHSEPASNFLIAYSTSQGRAAADDSPYAEALSNRLKERGLTIPQVFEKVKYDVSSLSNQIPYEQAKMTGPLCLAGCTVDRAGIYETNLAVYDSTRKDAEESIARLVALRAETRCIRGWEKVIRLRDSAVQQEKSKNLNTAGQTFERVKGEAMGIVAFLSGIDALAKSQIDLASIRRDSEEMLQAPRQRLAKSMYSLWRNNMESIMNSIRTMEKIRRQRVDWSELERIEKLADGYANSGKFEDATDEAIDGFNLANRLFSQLSGQRPPIPTEKPVRRDATKSAATIRHVQPPVMVLGTDCSVNP